MKKVFIITTLCLLTLGAVVILGSATAEEAQACDPRVQQC